MTGKADVSTLPIESELSDRLKARAARFVQEQVTDPYECAEILEMLGLEEM